MIRFLMAVGVVLVVVIAGPMIVSAEEDSPCQMVSNQAFLAIPGLFYADQPDSLFGLVMAWQDECGEIEPVVRLKILAAIWDDVFTEGVYDSRIMDHLIQRYDQGALETVSEEAAGFNSFTSDLADQLLPHVSPGTVELFFCLFYSGQQETAFDLLQSHDLAGTDLRWYYQRELSYLRREEARTVVALTGGVWRPEGDLFRVGDHALVGLTLGRRKGRWLGRLAAEYRPGRSAYPYFVDQELATGWSDRFDGFYLGLEVGREIVNYGPHRIDLFLGLGYDGIKPFWEEDLILGTININAGFGYRVFVGSGSDWVLGADCRFEHLGVRNTGGTPLSGEATTLRFSLGYSLGSDNRKRLAKLNR